jgi:hypothetical protein
VGGCRLAGSSPAASATPAWSSWKDARLLPARAQVRALPPELQAAVVERVMTPGSQPGSCGFESRRRFFLAVGELATPPALGAGDRRFDSCRPDSRGRGAAVLASLMSSRPWVRIPPALFGDVAQLRRALACRARGRGFEARRPRPWWPWCSGSTRDRDPRGVGSSPAGHPICADAEHVASSAGCNPAASGCGGSTPPVRTGDVAQVEEHLACTEEERVRLPPSPLPP